MTTDNDGGDGQKVVCEFGICTGASTFVENHDSCAIALEQPLNKVKGEATQAVSVGNHNF